MPTPNTHDHDHSRGDRRLAELRERWTASYGPLVAMQLEPDRRYSLVRVGSAEYAFTDHDRYVRSLRHVWGAQLVAEPLRSAMGAELQDVAPNLKAVDPDPDDLRPHDRGRSRRS
jgi:hypothetical protein